MTASKPRGSPCTPAHTTARASLDGGVHNLLLAAALTAALALGKALLALSDALLAQALVLLRQALRLLTLGDLGSHEAALVVKRTGSDEALDLGALLLLAALALKLAGHDVLANIVLLGQVVHLADVVGALGAEAAWALALRVREAGDIDVTLLDNDQVQHRQVGADDATTHALALALTGPARAVVRRTLGQEKTHTVVDEDTLHHWEALLVIATGDAEDVAVELLAEEVTVNLLRHALVVQNRAAHIQYVYHKDVADKKSPASTHAV